MAYINHTVSIENTKILLRINPRCEYCNGIFNENASILSEGFDLHHANVSNKNGIYYILIKCPFCEAINMKLFTIRSDRYGKFFEYGTHTKQKVKIKEETFPERIKEISPRFVSVYSQAVKSEKYNLDELSGMGYRKALEILIKDYAIYKYPNDKEKIMKKSLQDALKRIDTHEIKVLGQVATKIGNDETHYYRKHDWKISDLKNYIEAIVMFIMSDLSFDQADQRLSSDRNK